ncbi:MAG TPA: hypothetical protein VFU31_19285 [Candidatus Binatia bacterium]|nr:hypothetical protein [Candidatus Binatia bacterium]
MSGVGSNTTQLAKWLGAEDGKTSVQRLVKNQDLGKLIDQGITDYGKIRSSGQSAFDKYFADFQADAPGARRRTDQEVGVIDRFYDPSGVENDLLGLRNRRSAAANKAAELASMRAIRGLNSSRLLGSGTPSSYALRQRMRYLGDIGVQNAMDQTAQERADWDYLMNQRLGLGGRRTAMIDANTGRVMQPENVRRSLYGQNLGFLSNLGEQDRANTFYGLKYDPSFAEELGTAFDNSISTMRDLAGMGMMGGFQGMGGGMGGMGGGGGGGAAMPPAGTTQWGGYSFAPGSGAPSSAQYYNPYAPWGGYN